MNQPIPRLIVCAAIKMKDDSIILGIRHYSPDMRAVLKRLYGDDYKNQVSEQGFVDQSGVFLSREEAWNVAIMSGQILRNTLSLPKGELYSEHLY